MKDIKVKTGTKDIKMLDKADNLSKVVRNASIRTKDQIQNLSDDGQVTPDEYKDFFEIKKTLEKIALSVDTLQLWVDKSIADGHMESAE